MEFVENAFLDRWRARLGRADDVAVHPVASLNDVARLGVEPFLAALVRSSDDAVIGKTLDGVVVFWNDGATRLYGYEPSEMVGRDISVLIPSDRPHELSRLLSQVSEGRTVRELHTKRVRKDGAVVPVSITVSPVVGDHGQIVGASTIARDLTQHVAQMRSLREAERRADEALSTLETLQSSAPVGLGFVDRDFRIVHINEKLAAVNGSRVEDQVGKTVSQVVPEIWPQIEAFYRNALDNDEAVSNIEISGEIPTEPGRRHYWLASYYPVHLRTEIIGVGVVVVDVTELREAEEFRSIAMNQMAEGLFVIDDRARLTYMNVAATKMLGWTEADLIGTSLYDLGHTKQGDRTLVSPTMQSAHGDEDVYVCKDGSTIPVAYSAAPIFSGTVGHGAVVVFRDITKEKAERIRVERELAALTWVGRIREALDEDRFVLYSQPIVPLTGGRPSEELLLRMLGRNGELIAPGAFMGVAEKYSLIEEIDRWVVRQAVQLAATGRHVGANLSAESIVTLDLLALIEHELRLAAADPSNLVFEITETALMRDIAKGEAFARGVVELGCQLALDDFGTGFGTFTHVKRLPISFLKIDIEFIRDLVSSSANQHVVRAIVNLAKGFGCQTIAEGVENAETLGLLREFEVDFAQGFFLGRPAPIPDSRLVP